MSTCAVSTCPLSAGRTRYGVDMLMCGRHWKRVSPETQALVWQTYRAYMRGRGSGVDYLAARDRAIAEAAAGEPEQTNLLRSERP